MFRTWSESDEEPAIALWTDPRVTRLITTGEPPTRTEALERLDAQISLEHEHGVQYWPVFRLADGKHVGCCGLRPRDPDTDVWELGVHIRSELWGGGYAAEACRAVIDFAFGTLEVAALFAGHHPDNEPSQRLLERLGFAHTHNEVYPPTGREHPSYLLTRP
jgi:RimJ/RimL family protein N-acetyltransferase